MRYARGHREETRRKVVDAASRRFRRDGIAAAGVATLMADAGLTHGGFYAHFPSKEGLVEAAIQSALTVSRGHLVAAVEKARASGGDPLAAAVESYLSPLHRDRPEAGCAVASLAAELGRHAPATRAMLTREIALTVAVIRGALPAAMAAPQAEAAATAIFSLMVGALQIARAVSDPAVSEQIITAGRAAALALGRLRPGAEA